MDGQIVYPRTELADSGKAVFEGSPVVFGAPVVHDIDEVREWNALFPLATSFTATLTERRGEPVERIPTPRRLVDWLTVSGLAVDSCTAAQLELARELREAIHAAATATAMHAALPESAVRIINDRSVDGRAAAVLTPEGARHWRLSSAARVEDALGVIAADAISIVSGERDGKMALCASPTCRAAFFDTSQSRTRKWCEMNTCGNREKKARFLANQRKNATAAPTV